MLFTLGALCVASGLSAQSVPNIGKVKANATKAVAAANVRTEASSTLPDDTTEKAIPKVSRDSAAGTAAVSKGAAFERETFAYERSGRRDPFISLMSTSELRPLISELRLTAVAYDATGGRGSVAVLRDLTTKEQYRVKVGQSLGRMRVSGINAREVVFTIEEFGYSRQETLALGDSNKERKQ
jgi:hypothetical protein